MECESAALEVSSSTHHPTKEEEVFEVINGGGANTLSLSTYQILSSDPISRISRSHDTGEFCDLLISW